MKRLALLFTLVLASSAFILSAGAYAEPTEKVLYTFTGGNDGGNPYAGLIMDGQGNLYGTTVYGGAYNYGAVVRLSPGTGGQWTETVLHSFNFDGIDGFRPYSSLVRDAAGNLYGTTNIGGAYGVYGFGTVFELVRGPHDTWTEKVLHSFNDDGIDGYNPYANLVFDKQGNLYGTTYLGGIPFGVGTVFQLAPQPDGSWEEHIIHRFNYTDGGEPYGGLVLDQAGNLYGTTEFGGAHSHGTVFMLKRMPNGAWIQRVLHSFNPLNGDGFEPYAGLVIDKAGRLYGTTIYGGAGYGWGSVFEVVQVQGKWKERVIHSFEGTDDGFNPHGPLAIDAAGNLYGMTFQSIVNNIGGAGIVFKLSRTQNTWQETILHSFEAPSDGGNPYSGVVLDKTGNIFGTTYEGGLSYGVVFEVTP